MNYKLSVIIPVYNVEKYLKQCLNSVTAQEYNSFEVILVDDGSTDNSGAICDEFANTDSRIRVIHQKNIGHTGARQNGFLASTGDYILMIDSDDWIEEDMFRCMMEKALADDVDIVQCNYRSVKDGMEDNQIPVFQEGFYGKSRLEQEVYPKMIYAGGYYSFGIAPNMWNKIWKRSLMEKHLFRIDRKIRSGEDGLFTFACFWEAQKVWILNTCFYNYRSRAVSMCRITDDRRLEQNHILFDYYNKWFYNNVVFREQIEHYVVYQTLQAMEELLKTMKMKEVRRRYGFLWQESLERQSIRNIKLSEIAGKRNKLILMGLKIWK